MKKRKPSFYLFILYSTIMLWLLFVRQLPDIFQPDFSYWAHIRNHIHLIPFTTTRSFVHLLLQPDRYLSWMTQEAYLASCRHAIRNLGGNIILFVPLGFLLPRAFSRLQKLWKTLLCALAIMTCVEILQLLTLLGYCDIDDLILNTLGAAMGYGLHKLTQKFSPKQTNR